MSNRAEIELNKIAISKGYPDWTTMEDWIINHNSSVNTAILIKGAMLEAMKEVAISFGTWYSGMDRNKVESQFNQWNEQVEPIKSDAEFIAESLQEFRDEQVELGRKDNQ